MEVRTKQSLVEKVLVTGTITTIVLLGAYLVPPTIPITYLALSVLLGVAYFILWRREGLILLGLILLGELDEKITGRINRQ